MEQDEDFYLFHFKTVWCPYTKKHARDECVYAHNWQDFRRKPQLFPYSQEQCPQWHSKTFIHVYGDGCKNEFLCPYSHGWKEQEYHPKNYKMNACRNNTNCTKKHCPYFPSDTQKRSQIPDGFKLMPKNRGTIFQSNEYLAEYIQNQAPLVLPHRSKIYHPSTAPFVNSDVFMKQPYYIIHSALGFKDQSQFTFYLKGHAEDQQDHMQKKSNSLTQGNFPRTMSHNSHMNVGSSVPFYPGKGKVISKPVMHQINSYNDVNRRFPTSASHGMLAGMGEGQQNIYGHPPGLEGSMPSQTNLYRPQQPSEHMSENWNRHMYPQEGGYNNPNYHKWQNNGSQMIPSALQSQVQEPQSIKRKTGNMKGSMSTEFNYNFGERLTSEADQRAPFELFDNKTDSDEEEQHTGFLDNIAESMTGFKRTKNFVGQGFPTQMEPIRKFTGQSLGNVNESEEAKE